jgi:hypothetical protein
MQVSTESRTRAAVIIVVMVAACVSPSAQSIPFTNIARGTSSQIDESRRVVIRTSDEWQALWKSHASSQAPVVDFSKLMVVGVFAGTKPTAGYSIQIGAVRRDGSKAIVEYAEQSPAAGAIVAQVLTSPFHLVSIPRDVQDVEFRATTSRTP